MTRMSNAVRLAFGLTNLLVLLPLSLMLVLASFVLALMPGPFFLKALSLFPLGGGYALWRFFLRAWVMPAAACPRHLAILLWLTGSLCIVVLVLGFVQSLPLTELMSWYLVSPLVSLFSILLYQELSPRLSGANLALSAAPVRGRRPRKTAIRWFAGIWLTLVAIILFISIVGSLATYGVDAAGGLLFPGNLFNWALVLLLMTPAAPLFLPMPLPAGAGALKAGSV